MGNEITGLNWNWGIFNDHNKGGSSTIQMEPADDGAYRFFGNTTTKFVYSFAGFFANPTDDNTLEALKKAKSFSFKIKGGDGKDWAAKMATSGVSDFGYHEDLFEVVKGEKTVVIKVEDLYQPNWALPNKFNQKKATGLQFQTSFCGEASPFNVTIWDLKLFD
jgi:hypothetical protein